jgi:hypothetical protein
VKRKAAMLLALSIAALALVALPTGSLAAKGGNVGDATHGGGGGSGAGITFEPSTVSVGQTYQVHVSGLRANTWSTVGAYYISSDAAYWCSGSSDGSGNFSCGFTAEKSGSIRHEAYQKQANRYRLSATAFLDVTP